MKDDNKTTLVDKWIAAAKNHPITAAVVFGAVVLAGVASTIKSFNEVMIILMPQAVQSPAFSAPQVAESLSAVFLDPSPTSPRSVQLLVQNSGSEAAAIQHVVFNVRVKPDGILKSGFAVLFPTAGSKAVPGKASETLNFEPTAEGMFLPSEPSNPNFVEFFKNLGKGPDLNPDHFRRRWMEKATCEMSINIKFASGGRGDIFPEVTCIQLWPLVQAEFAGK